MVVSKETLTDFKEKFEKAYKLVDEESKHDPVTDPFRSHYTAREVLKEMMENLKNCIHSGEDNTEDQRTYKVILAFVYRDLGRISIFTEETAAGEKYLQNCLEIIEESKMQPEAIIAYMGALNELGIVWSNRGGHLEARNYLSQAEKLYEEFKASGKEAMSITDIFGTAEEIEKGKGPKELEKLYTLTMFYLAQVVGHLGDLELSAQYCHTTLSRQLEENDYEPIDWALNAATLSQYFLGPNKFTEARHHLAAATHILADYEAKMINPSMSEDAQAEVRETFKHRYADVARCWGKYGISLLVASRERLLSEKDEVPEGEKLNKGTKFLQLYYD